ncbi:SRPBCC family protein [Amycolatopsis anabasis]|uniref:SRPBCC family protein n=1 Tax=Amycolatopsis anabasis TaxID=1840409 RepID=UPI003CCCA087
MVSNVHQREYPVPPEELGRLLDTLSGVDDRLWPPGWPPMRFDAPLGVGADGGHGQIRYRVTAYQPGRRVEFRFDPAGGLAGEHFVEVLDGERADHSVLRHTAIGRPVTPRMRVLWALAIRWMHDAVLEELLDRAADELGHPPRRRARRSPWVRLLRKAMRVA